MEAVKLSEFDVKEFDKNEKSRTFAEEQSKILQQVADQFINWVFDSLTDQGLLINLNNRRNEYRTVFNKFCNSK